MSWSLQKTFMGGFEMRLRSCLGALALVFSIGSVPVFAFDRNQDQGERSRDGHTAIHNGDSNYPQDTRGYQNNEREREREWREYLKQQKKAHKEWAKASREEQKDFDKYLREREKDRRESNRETDKEYRETC